jgi:hypothetical protein
MFKEMAMAVFKGNLVNALPDFRTAVVRLVE